MNVKFNSPVLCSSLALFSCSLGAHADPIAVNLGSAGSYAVLAGSTVTNTDTITSVVGNLGVWPGTAVTGFPPGIVISGVTHAGDTAAMQAQADLTSAFNFAAAEKPSTNLTGKDLGGRTLTPGVYSFDSSAQLTGDLTLDALGDPNAVFLFQVGSALTTASASSVTLVNGARGSDLFWQIGSSATLGTTTNFAGSILALSSITLDTGASISCGRALARNGAVTLDSNTVSIGSCGSTPTITPSPVPEPGTATLLGTGIVSLIGVSRRFRRSAV